MTYGRRQHWTKNFASHSTVRRSRLFAITFISRACVYPEGVTVMTYISFLLLLYSFFVYLHYLSAVMYYIQRRGVTLKSNRLRSLKMGPIDRSYRACVTITSSGNDLVCVLLASSLQAHRSADKCLARCLYSNGVVQAVTFGYLIYWLVFVVSVRTSSNFHEF